MLKKEFIEKAKKLINKPTKEELKAIEEKEDGELGIVNFEEIDGIAFYVEVYESVLGLVGNPINQRDDNGDPCDWDNTYWSSLRKSKLNDSNYLANKMYEQYKLFKCEGDK